MTMKKILVLIFLNILLVLPNLSLGQDISHATVYWTENGQQQEQTFNAGTTNIINRDVGTQTDIRICRQSALSGTSTYQIADINNGLSQTRDATGDCWFFSDVSGSLETELWATVNTLNGLIKIQIFNITDPKLPNLTISNMTVNNTTTPSSYEVGQTVDVDLIVFNLGDVESSSSRLGYYIGDSPEDLSNRWETDFVSSLQSKTGSNESELYTFQESDIGTKYFVFKADENNEIEESSEQDNVTSFGPFTVNAKPVTNLQIEVNNVSGGNPELPGSAGNVQLFDQVQNSIVTSDGTNSSGVSVFNDIDATLTYYIDVYHEPESSTPFSDEYWGSKRDITLSTGVTNTETFTRNTPYSRFVKIYDAQTGEELTGQTVAPGRELEARITMANPANGVTRMVRGRVLFDRDRAGEMDVDKTIDSGGTVNVGNDITQTTTTFTPTQEGSYYRAVETLTDVNGNYTTTDGSGWNTETSFIVAQPVANLQVEVNNVSGGNPDLPGVDGIVRLYNQNWQLLQEVSTNTNGIAFFSDLDAGITYNIQAFHDPNNPTTIFGEEFWGASQNITLSANSTESISITRYTPYQNGVRVYDANTGSEITGQSVALDTPLIFEVDIANPATYSQLSRARLVLDSDPQTTERELDGIEPASFTTVSAGTQETIQFTYTPTVAGDYYNAVGTITEVNNTGVITDGSPMSTMALFTAINTTGVEIPETWGTIVSIENVALWGNVYEIHFYENNIAVYLQDELLVNKNIIEAILLHHTVESSGIDAISKISDSVFLQEQIELWKNTSTSHATKTKSYDLNELSDEIASQFLKSSAKKLAYHIGAGAVTGASVGSIGFSLGPLGTITTSGGAALGAVTGATIWAFDSATGDFVELRGNAVGDDFIITERQELLKSIAFTANPDQSERRLLALQNQEGYARTAQDQSEAFRIIAANIEAAKDIVAFTSTGLDLKKIGEFWVEKSAEIFVNEYVLIPIQERETLNLNGDVAMLKIATSIVDHHQELSVLSDRISIEYSRLNETLNISGNSVDYLNNVITTLQAINLYKAVTYEVLYSEYMRAKHLRDDHNPIAIYEYPDQILTELETKLNLAINEYEEFGSLVRSTINSYDEYLQYLNVSYIDLNIEFESDKDLYLLNQVAQHDLLDNNFKISLLNNFDYEVSIDELKVESLNSPFTDRIISTNVSILPNSKKDIFIPLDLGNDFDLGYRYKHSLSINGTIAGEVIERKFDFVIEPYYPIHITNVLVDNTMPNIGDVVNADVAIQSLVSRQVDVESKLLFGNEVLATSNHSVSVSENEVNYINLSYDLSTFPTTPKGEYSILFTLDVDGIKHVLQTRNVFTLLPETDGDLAGYSFPNSKIISAIDDIGIADLLNEAIDGSEILYRDGLTAGDLLPAMENNNLILLGGDQANPLVEDLVNRGLIANNLWNKPGDVHVIIVDDPFYPLVSLGKKAIVVAGFTKEGTYTAGLKLLNELIKSNETQNIDYLGSIKNITLRAGDTRNQEAEIWTHDDVRNLFSGGAEPISYTIESSHEEWVTTDLQENLLSISAQKGNINGNAATITITATDSNGDSASGQVDVTVVPAFGDVSADTNVNSFDASLVLRNAVELIEFNAIQEDIADVDRDTRANSYDASLILRYAVELINEIPFNSGTSTAVVTATSSTTSMNSSELADGRLVWGDPNQEQSTTSIPIRIESSGAIYSVDFTGSFDASLGSISDIVYKDLSEGWVAEDRVDEDEGRIYIAMAGSRPFEGDHIASLEFELLNPYTTIPLEGSGMINTTGFSMEKLEVREVPDEFALNSNYPNPFNPSTTISYQLPSNSDIQMEVFNITGQRVLTLEDGAKDAGMHTLTFDMSGFSSGVYFIRMQATSESSSFKNVKKMTLIK